MGVQTFEADGLTLEVWYPASDERDDLAPSPVDANGFVPDAVVALLGTVDLPTIASYAHRDAPLRRTGELPAGWWLRPVAHHGRLAPEEQPGVLVWFFAGGVGFGLSVLGCFGVGAGVLLQAWRAGLL